MSACHFEEVSGGVASRWVVELSVVKHVERVDSDLDLTLARDSDALFQADVRIVPSGADNEVAHRIANLPDRLRAVHSIRTGFRDFRAVNPEPAARARIQVLEISAVEIRHVYTKCAQE